MRRFVLGVIVVLAVSAGLQAQTNTVRVQQIMISHGNLNYVLPITQDAFYLGDPVISVPAEAMRGATLGASRFVIRCWREGGALRTVVYAVVASPDAPNKTLETAIATYAIKDSGAVRVLETAEWGATPIVLRPVRPLR